MPVWNDYVPSQHYLFCMSSCSNNNFRSLCIVVFFIVSLLRHHVDSFQYTCIVSETIYKEKCKIILSCKIFLSVVQFGLMLALKGDLITTITHPPGTFLCPQIEYVGKGKTYYTPQKNWPVDPISCDKENLKSYYEILYLIKLNTFESSLVWIKFGFKILPWRNGSLL